MSIASTYFIDEILIRLGERLQITKSDQELAEDRYRKVSQWLEEDDFLKSTFPYSFPQGSLRMGITTKPIANNEFDLDFVFQMQLQWKDWQPTQILDHIEQRLRSNPRYADLVAPKNTCVRLIYANQFHLDIVPGCLISEPGTAIMIPNRKMNIWFETDPKGFASWFESQADLYTLFLKQTVDSAEPLPGWISVAEQPPLKKAVQLIKRHRDVSFQHSPKEHLPASILLTALSGLAYQGHTSIYEVVEKILQKVVDDIEALPPGQRLYVYNPASRSQEDLSRAWTNPETYKCFVSWIKAYRNSWIELGQVKGVQNVATLLKRLFGEDISNAVIKDVYGDIEDARSNNNLAITPDQGHLIIKPYATVPVIPVRKNTFYGE